MNFSMSKSAKTQNPVFDTSEVMSHSSFPVAPRISTHSSSISAAAFSSRWVPVEHAPCVGRPLAFEHDCPDYLSLPKPSQSKSFFIKPSNTAVQSRKVLMFSDRFYAGASQIKAINVNQPSHKEHPIQIHQFVGNTDNLLAENFESPVDFLRSDRLSAENFCKDAVERARSASAFWRRRKKKLAAGGMPADKTGLLSEATRLKSVVPPRLRPLKPELVKGTRPLKDESSKCVNESEQFPDIFSHEAHFLRNTLTSSGLHPDSHGDDGAHPSFVTEMGSDSRLSLTSKQEPIVTSTKSLLPLGIFIVAPRDEISLIKSSTHHWTPRQAKTPELKQSSSFSEPLKAILKGAYDRRASDAMFCQLYLNVHVKNFEDSKIAQIAVPESMQQDFIIDDSMSSGRICAFDEKPEIDDSSKGLNNQASKLKIPLIRPQTPSKSTLIQTFADKMGRPPAKPNMARELIKAQKDSIKADALARISHHKKLSWSALTPEAIKQKQKAKLEKEAEDLNMPEGCWEVASWFR
jgi:hypothetical protein